jgi:hypothetical protein
MLISIFYYGELEYLPVITSGLLIMALLTLFMSKKNLRIQSEYQIYARMMEARVKLETTQAFTKIAAEQFYILRAYMDLYEFLFRLYKNGMIDEQFWLRWALAIKAMKSIPKFLAVWNKTKNVHTNDFVKFVNSI